MKRFEFIVTKDDNDKLDFDISSEGFSTFELAGFVKYLEIELEFKMIDIIKKKPEDSE